MCDDFAENGFNHDSDSNDGFDENGFRLVFHDSVSGSIQSFDGEDLLLCPMEALDPHNCSKSTMKTESCTSLYEQSDSSLECRSFLSTDNNNKSFTRMAPNPRRSFKFESPKMQSGKPTSIYSRPRSVGRTGSFRDDLPQQGQKEVKRTEKDDSIQVDDENSHQESDNRAENSRRKNRTSRSKSRELEKRKGVTRTKIRCTSTSAKGMGQDLEAARKLVEEHLARSKSRRQTRDGDTREDSGLCESLGNSKPNSERKTKLVKVNAGLLEFLENGQVAEPKLKTDNIDSMKGCKSRSNSNLEEDFDKSSEESEETSEALSDSKPNPPTMTPKDMNFGAAAAIICAKVRNGSIQLPKSRRGARPTSRSKSRNTSAREQSSEASETVLAGDGGNDYFFI